MSNLSRFLKENKALKGNTEYAPTKSLVDENGEPLKWLIKPISSKENEEIRESCIKEIPIPGKPNMYRPKTNTAEYMAKLIISSVVEPDLYNAQLQDSYGVKTPEDLLYEMVDDPGEYQEFQLFIQKLNGFDIAVKEKINEAKN
jgi:hypothetical protein